MKMILLEMQLKIFDDDINEEKIDLNGAFVVVEMESKTVEDEIPVISVIFAVLTGGM